VDIHRAVIGRLICGVRIWRCPLLARSGHRRDGPIVYIAASAISGNRLGSSHRIAGGGGLE
jgi:hypothetical protein